MRRGPSTAATRTADAPAAKADESPQPVEVLSRKIVGAFDVAVVRENQPGALNDWLTNAKNYQPLPEGADASSSSIAKKATSSPA